MFGLFIFLEDDLACLDSCFFTTKGVIIHLKVIACQSKYDRQICKT
jgi:hypothetical protein